MTDDQRKAAGRFAAQMRAEIVARRTAEGVTRALQAAARKVAAEKHLRRDSSCLCGRCA